MNSFTLPSLHDLILIYLVIFLFAINIVGLVIPALLSFLKMFCNSTLLHRKYYGFQRFFSIISYSVIAIAFSGLALNIIIAIISYNIDGTGISELLTVIVMNAGVIFTSAFLPSIGSIALWKWFNT
nr:hypothetical protein [uncultured bacterium]